MKRIGRTWSRVSPDLKAKAQNQHSKSNSLRMKILVKALKKIVNYHGEPVTTDMVVPTNSRLQSRKRLFSQTRLKKTISLL